MLRVWWLKGGAILSIQPLLSGLLAAPGFTTTYTASKFAVVGYTLALRHELADRGVQVSALCPGAIDTPMNHGVDA
ncbi:MAG: SDR family NAD(P)-dependent oxidoreductase [Candidatus Thiodiazotropha sp. (ex. Lucinoma kazani)]